MLYWKARREMCEKQLKNGDFYFRTNPYNRHRTICAAGYEAKYLERVEMLLRES